MAMISSGYSNGDVSEYFKDRVNLLLYVRKHDTNT